MTVIVRSAALSQNLAKTPQAFLYDPDLLFIPPIPPPAKVVGRQNLNG
ncbi:hypothetical protein RB623_29440 [Mesorhizobium sp. LHD-90]|nr:hypothetical protein [Mesorhizobium sp. LHD-90]MDQ6438193.1 hypothetical protein [Mesorhizobium sp. LHD-90]